MGQKSGLIELLKKGSIKYSLGQQTTSLPWFKIFKLVWSVKVTIIFDFICAYYMIDMYY